jgi:hypothetical protein
MKKYFLTVLLFLPVSTWAQHPPSKCPSIAELQSSIFSMAEKQNQSYDLLGTVNIPDNLWWLYSYSIPGKDMSEAIKKANTALLQGKISSPPPLDCSYNCCTCKYKFFIDNSLERDLEALVMF